ncbi:hypothetical protein PDE_04237 [Penicillium oxalicum 114-2]|uniref:Uncharacterized protein n=1 Tax=Penicillium oxalicum (strain 114-2 / CGMCC 5302) TaxID=933388 RepID=S8AT63_PENO1|nr:hypothetical protein PDE_04237 [Penicillium oxalicum 114-2]
MSATTTTTATRGSLSVLADYEVHHSGSEQVNAPTTTSAHVEPASEWPSHWRRMPAYRPVNRQLDQNDRPAGNGHPAEYAFIQIMLHGCWINSTMAKLWGATGGKINDKIFYYDIGGEF